MHSSAASGAVVVVRVVMERVRSLHRVDGIAGSHPRDRLFNPYTFSIASLLIGVVIVVVVLVMTMRDSLAMDMRYAVRTLSILLNQKERAMEFTKNSKRGERDQTRAYTERRHIAHSAFQASTMVPIGSPSSNRVQGRTTTTISQDPLHQRVTV